MKTRKQRIATTAVLFLLPACYGCAVNVNQNGAPAIGACKKLSFEQQQPCLDGVAQANQRKLEQSAIQ